MRNSSNNYTLPNNNYPYTTPIINNDSNEPPKRKSKLTAYIAIVLITSIVTSVSVGSALYAKFSSDLDSRLAAQLNTLPSLNAAESNNSDSSNNYTAVPASLAAGSSVTQIAKAVVPSVVGIRMTVASTGNNYF